MIGIFLIAALGIASAADPSIGSWKLNAAKSKLTGDGEHPGAVNIEEVEGDWLRVTKLIKEYRITYRMKRDGQDYPVTGAIGYNTVASLRIDAQSHESVYKTDGREVRRCTARVAVDGRSCECRCVSLDAVGKKVVSVLSWDLVSGGLTPEGVLALLRDGRLSEARLAAVQLLDRAARGGASTPRALTLLWYFRGSAENQLGRYADAAASLSRGIQLWDEFNLSVAETPALLLDLLVSRAEAATHMASFAEAEGALRRARKVAEQRLPPGHPRVASILDGFGALECARRDTKRAEQAFRRALAILVAHYGPEHPETIAESNSLASLLVLTGRQREAVPLLERAHKVLLQTRGPRHPNTICALENLGTAKIKASPADGERLLREALSAWRETQPENKTELITMLASLALARYEQGDLAGALRFSQESLEAAMVALGPGHPQLKNRTEDHARLLKLAGKDAEAAALSHRVDVKSLKK